MAERNAGLGAPIFVDETQCFARMGDVLVAVSLTEPTPAMLADLALEVKEHAARGGAASGIFILVDKAGDPPGEAARANIRRLLVGVAGSCAGLACFVEGEGFVAATKRSAMTLVVMATRASFPVKIFGSSLEAAGWLLDRVGKTASKGLRPAQIASGAEALRARLSAGELSPRRRVARRA